MPREHAAVTPELGNIFTPVSSDCRLHRSAHQVYCTFLMLMKTGEGSSNTTVFASLFMLLGALGRENYSIDELRYDYHRGGGGAGDRPEMTTILVPLHSMHSAINQLRA